MFPARVCLRLVMANVHSSVACTCAHGDRHEQLVKLVNTIVYENTTPDKFVTFFCGIYNAQRENFHTLSPGTIRRLFTVATDTLNSLPRAV
jgi:serine phosphatase RsbU (regulator of sigma subunit)